MHEDLDNLILGEANVERRPDMAAQRAVAAKRRQAGHRAKATARQVEAGPRPGCPPVVFAAGAAKIALRLGWRLGSSGGLIAHMVQA